jgi:hypothetical protein
MIRTGGPRLERSLQTGLRPDYNQDLFKTWLKSLIGSGTPEDQIGSELSLTFLPLDDEIPRYSKRFLDHMVQQEAYVERMNSLMEEESVLKTPFQCFLEDQVYPRLPQKLALPPKIEARLPWYQRLYRKFCVPYQGAVCQASMLDSFWRSTTERRKVKKELLRQTFDQMNFDYFVHFMCLTDRYLPTDFGYITESGLKLVHPQKLHCAATVDEINEAHYTDDSYFSKEELEQYSTELLVNYLERSEPTDVSYATRDISFSLSEESIPPIERATPIVDDGLALVYSETLAVDHIDEPELRKQLLPHLINY